MYDQQARAARLLSVGDSMADVAKAVDKSEKTVKSWLLDPEFRQVLLDNMSGAALRVILGYFADEHQDKDKVMAALAWLRMTKPTKPVRSRNGPGEKPSEEEETDLSEFTSEQLKRITGD